MCLALTLFSGSHPFSYSNKGSDASLGDRKNHEISYIGLHLNQGRTWPVGSNIPKCKQKTRAKKLRLAQAGQSGNWSNMSSQVPCRHNWRWLGNGTQGYQRAWPPRPICSKIPRLKLDAKNAARCIPKAFQHRTSNCKLQFVVVFLHVVYSICCFLLWFHQIACPKL